MSDWGDESTAGTLPSSLFKLTKKTLSLPNSPLARDGSRTKSLASGSSAERDQHQKRSIRQKNPRMSPTLREIKVDRKLTTDKPPVSVVRSPNAKKRSIRNRPTSPSLINMSIDVEKPSNIRKKSTSPPVREMNIDFQSFSAYPDATLSELTMSPKRIGQNRRNRQSIASPVHNTSAEGDAHSLEISSMNIGSSQSTAPLSNAVPTKEGRGEPVRESREPLNVQGIRDITIPMTIEQNANDPDSAETFRSSLPISRSERRKISSELIPKTITADIGGSGIKVKSLASRRKVSAKAPQNDRRTNTINNNQHQQQQSQKQNGRVQERLSPVPKANPSRRTEPLQMDSTQMVKGIHRKANDQITKKKGMHREEIDLISKEKQSAAPPTSVPPEGRPIRSPKPKDAHKNENERVTNKKQSRISSSKRPSPPRARQKAQPVRSSQTKEQQKAQLQSKQERTPPTSLPAQPSNPPRHVPPPKGDPKYLINVQTGLKSQKQKGLLIVDPKDGGRKCKLSYDDHSLTDKDLYIHQNQSETSSVTDATYPDRRDRLHAAVKSRVKRFFLADIDSVDEESEVTEKPKVTTHAGKQQDQAKRLDTEGHRRDIIEMSNSDKFVTEEEVSVSQKESNLNGRKHPKNTSTEEQLDETSPIPVDKAAPLSQRQGSYSSRLSSSCKSSSSAEVEEKGKLETECDSVTNGGESNTDINVNRNYSDDESNSDIESDSDNDTRNAPQKTSSPKRAVETVLTPISSVKSISQDNFLDHEPDPQREKRIVYVTRIYIAPSLPKKDLDGGNSCSDSSADDTFSDVPEDQKDIKTKQSLNLSISEDTSSYDTSEDIVPLHSQIGLQSTWNAPLLTHDLGIQFEEYKGDALENGCGDAMGRGVTIARVQSVVSGSNAELAGVITGDFVSFAVALKNISDHDQKDHLIAVKIAKRLEEKGMRTSYRELFDMFLSKTIAGRPVAMVFCRPMSSSDDHYQPMIDECRWAAHFLRSLTAKSREEEIERVAGGKHEIVRGNIEKFLPMPKGRHYSVDEQSNDFLSPVQKLGNPMPVEGEDSNSDSFFSSWKPPMINVMQVYGCCNSWQPNEPFLSANTNTYKWAQLTSFVNEAHGILYVRCNRTTFGASVLNGSGIILSRLDNGKWSAPSAVGVVGMGIGVQIGKDEIECIIFVNSKVTMKEFLKKNQVALGSNMGVASHFGKTEGFGFEHCGLNPLSMKDKSKDEDSADFYAIARRRGLYLGISLASLFIYTRDHVNTRTYQGSDDRVEIDNTGILQGAVPPPSIARDLYSALLCLESPYSMYLHPLTPMSIRNYIFSEWSSSMSCVPSLHGEIEGPITDKSMTLRAFLGSLTHSTVKLKEERRELEIFYQKSQRFLSDGVPVKYITPNQNPGNAQMYHEFRTMYLLSEADQPMVEAKLLLVPKKGDQNTQNKFPLSVSLKTISHISHSPPHASGLDETERSRFFCIHRHRDLSYNENVLMFLAKSDKDTAILLCGLKLFLEQDYL